MRLALLTALTMLAFAANSILNRMAVADGDADPLSFALIRVLAGAVTLSVLALSQRRGVPVLVRMLSRRRVLGALTLSLYLLGFSIAYTSLDAGLGALILFGGVQITMFSGAVLGGDLIPARRWLGAGAAFAGLSWLMWPGGAQTVPLIQAGAMGLAAFGWGVYSLAGRAAKDPLTETAANFVLAVPVCFVVAWLLPFAPDAVMPTLRGAILAIISGAVTSGLGYALWYAVLPKLGASVGGLVQLTVPILATLGGVLVLGEGVSLRLIGAGVLVLGGIAFGLGRPQRKIGSSGS
jgi:drug/metabolite transporter (DMT)-like permease